MGIGLENVAVLVEGLDHPEGVTVDAHGTLWAGGEGGQIYRIDVEAGKPIQVGDTSGFLLGMCADGRGRIYCCDVARREVLRFDPNTGDVSVYTSGADGRPLVNPNWPVFDRDGNLYVTDSGTWKGNDGCVLKVDPAGDTTVWTEECSNFPNGACMLPDGSGLYVLESCKPGLSFIPITADGTAGPLKNIATLDGTIPDGITLDTNGAAYVCCYRPDRILRVDPSGNVEILADDPEGTLLSAPTNGVWYGKDRSRLVTGNLGRWHLSVCDWGVRGEGLHYPELDP